MAVAHEFEEHSVSQAKVHLQLAGVSNLSKVYKRAIRICTGTEIESRSLDTSMIATLNWWSDPFWVLKTFVLKHSGRPLILKHIQVGDSAAFAGGLC